MQSEIFTLSLLATLCALALTSCSEANGLGDGGGIDSTQLAVQVVASGLDNPLYLTAPRGDPRQFVVEQAGRVRLIKNGQLVARPFLDITDRVGSGGERGLFSIAFHPDYGLNGFFYASYTDRSGDSRVERYSVTADPDVGDPGSAKLILSVAQPFSNHNGGLILFGPDGMLYIGLGDGGSLGDPHGNGQNRNTLLGALLRIDVDGDPYRVPPDNPFVGEPDARGEIWAYGLRNPWRFAFDSEAGLLYIADVGESRWEEVNVEPSSSAGLNYGWNVMEGRHCYARDPCDPEGLVVPPLEYSHSDGCSVTGGFVYRGATVPTIRGHYFYSDYCSGFLRSFRYRDGGVTGERSWSVGDLGSVLSFGIDGAGELYILSGNGRVYRLIEARS